MGRAAEQGARSTALQQIVGGSGVPGSRALGTSAALSQIGAGFNAPLSRLFGERQLQFQAPQQTNPLLSTLGLIAGQAGGAFAGGAGSAFGRRLFA